MSLNTSALMGRLTTTPELKATNSGLSVTSFTLAVSRTKEITDFIDCVAWRQTAEFITKYFEKGQQIAVVGQITTRNYEDKSGNKRKATEVVVSSAYFAESKKDAPQVSEQPLEKPNLSVVNDDDDELPF